MILQETNNGQHVHAINVQSMNGEEGSVVGGSNSRSAWKTAQTLASMTACWSAQCHLGHVAVTSSPVDQLQSLEKSMSSYLPPRFCWPSRIDFPDQYCRSASAPVLPLLSTPSNAFLAERRSRRGGNW